MKMNLKMNLKRNFQVKNAGFELDRGEKLTMLRLVNRILSIIEAHPEANPSQIINRNCECPEFQHWSAEVAWLESIGSKESEVVGFVIWTDDKQQVNDLEGSYEWSEWPTCVVHIPALAELTRQAV